MNVRNAILARLHGEQSAALAAALSDYSLTPADTASPEDLIHEAISLLSLVSSSLLTTPVPTIASQGVEKLQLKLMPPLQRLETRLSALQTNITQQSLLHQPSTLLPNLQLLAAPAALVLTDEPSLSVAMDETDLNVVQRNDHLQDQLLNQIHDGDDMEATNKATGTSNVEVRRVGRTNSNNNNTNGNRQSITSNSLASTSSTTADLSEDEQITYAAYHDIEDGEEHVDDVEMTHMSNTFKKKTRHERTTGLVNATYIDHINQLSGGQSDEKLIIKPKKQIHQTAVENDYDDKNAPYQQEYGLIHQNVSQQLLSRLRLNQTKRP